MSVALVVLCFAVGMFALACGAQHNQMLQTLDVRWNQIGADGATALAEALKVRCVKWIWRGMGGRNGPPSAFACHPRGSRKEEGSSSVA